MTSIEDPRSLAIIGAGPIGLEAGIYALNLGYDVKVFERGCVGENILCWGHVKMFSPWRFNYSRLGAMLLAQDGENFCPAADECPTGREYVEAYLIRLSRLSILRGRIFQGTKIVAISRQNLLKHDLIGDVKRGEKRFRILTQGRDGQERVFYSDFLIDASGVYGNHNYVGDGGIPALGERANVSSISYLLDDVLGKDRNRYAGKRTLVIGSGYSAATSACDLDKLASEVEGTSVLWITIAKGDKKIPYKSIPGDELIERDDLIKRANAIADGASPHIQHLRGIVVEEIHRCSENGSVTVTMRKEDETFEEEFDRVLANVGYSPDNSIYSELQVHECWATKGPIKLATELLGIESEDCLEQASHGVESLINPEPGFFILGSKSYGLNSTFLIKVGLLQIKDVFSYLQNDSKLDLYADSALHMD